MPGQEQELSAPAPGPSPADSAAEAWPKGREASWLPTGDANRASCPLLFLSPTYSKLPPRAGERRSLGTEVQQVHCSVATSVRGGGES